MRFVLRGTIRTELTTRGFGQSRNTDILKMERMPSLIAKLQTLFPTLKKTQIESIVNVNIEK